MPISAQKLAPLQSITTAHADAPELVATRLQVDPAQGLTTATVEARLDNYGHNRISEKPPRPVWRKLLDQFNNFLVLVLLGAVVLAAVVGNLKDAVVIAIVIVINALLGFYQ